MLVSLQAARRIKVREAKAPKIQMRKLQTSFNSVAYKRTTERIASEFDLVREPHPIPAIARSTKPQPQKFQVVLDRILPKRGVGNPVIASNGFLSNRILNLLKYMYIARHDGGIVEGFHKNPIYSVLIPDTPEFESFVRTEMEVSEHHWAYIREYAAVHKGRSDAILSLPNLPAHELEVLDQLHTRLEKMGTEVINMEDQFKTEYQVDSTSLTQKEMAVIKSWVKDPHSLIPKVYGTIEEIDAQTSRTMPDMLKQFPMKINIPEMTKTARREIDAAFAPYATKTKKAKKTGKRATKSVMKSVRSKKKSSKSL